ncbi:hypothetical protein E2I00_012927 [Balaenoptera physalus]|uniref:Uncharacterized protein n=1 Tax=Balaenoptera physalus TaxID=9770 RepID=A0A643C748_BALPH|nr:hypothetical protein E2I00_012927 [Balaenoptera physalus]
MRCSSRPSCSRSSLWLLDF